MDRLMGIFITLVFVVGAGIHGCAHADPVSLEQICVALGAHAVRGETSEETWTFEALGCCYNDGDVEPEDC